MAAHCLAYIDPGSSNYLFQLLIAGMTTVVFFFSAIKRKLLSWFKRDLPKPPVDPVNKVQSETKPIVQ
ncbi:MAG: hypothetical protein ACTHLW_15595 [Verrucomicrobiota bacterium]